MYKKISVSIIGCGSRGFTVYGRLMRKMPGKFDVLSICDQNAEKLKTCGDEFGISEENRFLSEEEFFAERRSDLLVIATLDNAHIGMAKKAILLGYKILLEKPISNNVEELNELSRLAREHNAFVMVCHVLRYTWANRTIMEVLKSGRLGKLIEINHTEQVGFWHFAHSYVRGNWRNTDVSAPMIMAKSCHDLDLLQEYAGSPCKKLSSIGDLSWFKPQNAPEGAAERCINCKYADSCAYSAKLKYITWWKEAGCPQCWSYNVLSAKPLTEEIVTDALKNGPYGRCVFACDNNVADNQLVQMEFENGVRATFNVTAFTKYLGRKTTFYLSGGTLVYDEGANSITEMPFGGSDVVHEYKASDEFGHGGGDVGLIHALYSALTDDNAFVDTSLDNSIESHLMAIAAEQSRLAGGETVEIRDLKN